MKVLVLGAAGMLGHRLLLHLSGRGFEVRGTLRGEESSYQHHGIFCADNCFFGIDVRDKCALERVIRTFRPDAVVNAVGVVKQREDAKKALPSLEINAVLPHRLAEICADTAARIVQMSTDCVFSGARGNYKETDRIDANDIYGLTKYLGELSAENCVTLRTSIIGPELENKQGLFEWFLAQHGTVRGFRHAIYSGFTTFEMARIVERVLVEWPAAQGVYHVSSDPISKYDLLCKIKPQMGLSIEIIPDNDFHCDRSLDSTRFRNGCSYLPPSWDMMLAELCRSRRAATHVA